VTSPRPREPLSPRQPVSPVGVLDSSEIGGIVTKMRTHVKFRRRDGDNFPMICFELVISNRSTIAHDRLLSWNRGTDVL
jgi:hypothetical protein